MAKILVVDDNVDMLDTLEHLFTFYDYEVLRAENGKEGLEIAETSQPGLIVLDALMPVMNGFETCENLKRNVNTRDIPVIFLSANYTEYTHRLRGYELGADDYMLKPFNAKELIAKVSSLLHRKKIIKNLRSDNRNLLKRQTGAQTTAPELQQHHFIDYLTGIYNIDYFSKWVTQFSELQTADQHYSVLLIDADRFKLVNETYGDLIGDFALMKIANIILQNSRQSDFAFRLGKNKFAMLLNVTEESGAFYIGEKIRSAIEQTAFFDQDIFQYKRQTSRRKNEPVNITVSIGVSSLMDSNNVGKAIKLAENALNKAKEMGRNVTIRSSQIQVRENSTPT